MTNDSFLKLHEFIQIEHSNICQIAAQKDGQTVYENCWNGFSRTDAAHVMSVTKSVVSLLVGIAIDKGLIESVEQNVLEFFPDFRIKRGEKTIQSVTLRHILTMTAPYKYKSEPWSKVCSQDDWTLAALDLLGGKAGITWAFKYSTRGIHILTGIISKTSGETTVNFANRYLFEPFGIPDHRSICVETLLEHKEFILSEKPRTNLWFADPKDIASAGFGLCLSAVDMVKIGELCRNDGAYAGKQIVPAQWIRACTKPYYQCDETFDNMQYGYLWWIINKDAPIYAAIGDGGNVIYVNPQNNTVVAVTATFNPRFYDCVQMIQQRIESLL